MTSWSRPAASTATCTPVGSAGRRCVDAHARAPSTLDEAEVREPDVTDQQALISGSIVIPDRERGFPDTPREELDAALRTLSQRAPAWCDLGVDARLDLLREMVDATLEVAPDWASAAAAAKGIGPSSA